ncbi:MULTISPECIES: hypothetical protein [Leptolyngbya]|jgi:vacuolar-type H+-ATPase subunit I/STV1|nr:MULTISPECIES: hypothetical protein [Leptolyngbya]MBD2368863.1 hypothetical protein [Leptolyngbya sp. FACHB-161]MBD2375269.1 hypothetical protein [Leptolyngbya sp. FACHB-238]MBD2399687.1 hypothetical protein [Leptolyngbya sp. FACHB-239]MBD2405893.1 hypothetical protein [Leptolyngbya sp. FACHB-402]ULP32713.1 hypothetical protein MCP04_13260 [Leptolyngbya boryana IU 594]
MSKSNLNLDFYANLLQSMNRSIDGFQNLVESERADKEEALQMAGELESIVALRDARIAELEAENAALKTGFEATETKRLQEIGDMIEQLHNAIAGLSNPTQPETETTEDEIDLEEEAEDSDPVESV